MKKQISLALLALSIPLSLLAQHGKGLIHGNVTEVTEEGKTIPLPGANVYWLGTTTGTTTGADGHFHLDRLEETVMLIISYVGYRNDTVDVSGKNHVEVQLNASVMLDEVEVVHRQKSTEISMLDPLKTANIDEKELLKAACCNLSESFETNPSVDVSFTDAVTGTRQIQMLGLAGPYTQITRENMPYIRGLSSIYGLTYVPGPWVESIQLIKGTGSVVNGYESIAGQINVELRKPEDAERLYLNLYGNQSGRIEGNANLAHRLTGGKWSTALILHGKDNSVKWDMNNDGFLDKPLGRQFIGLNRWKYIGENGIRFQFGVKGTYIDKSGGQTDTEPSGDVLTADRWRMQLNTQRYEGWAKIGKVFKEMPWKSVALQASGATHRQDSYFGTNEYDATQNTFYANFLYQSILSNTNHKFTTGASFQYDDYDEMLNDTTFAYTEMVPGAYFEYTYSNSDRFDAVAGIRADHHNIYGPFFTPRLHLRYALTESTVLRAGAGRGQRTASILSENIGLLSSSRQIVIQGEESDKPYGLDPEVAWNYGVNLTQSFLLEQREGNVSLDFYRTDFENQIVMDLDQSPQKAVFYNLQGKSYSNSFQAQIDYEVISHFDVRLAYRWYDVRTTFNGELLQKPLIAEHRAFLNLAYETHNRWKFDYTFNWQGRKRISSTAGNPVEYQLPERSPDFVLMNAQVTKVWNETFEVYLGVENLLDYRQPDPILASDQPFGTYFDSSLIWGPVFGRNAYVGLRYRL